jgi:chemotaxis protein histidine kinase CheA
MELMNFLGQLTDGELATLAKGTITIEMRDKLKSAKVEFGSDRDLIKAAKAALDFRKKQAQAQATETTPATEPAAAAAEPAAATTPAAEPAATPTAAQVLSIRERLALASAMIDISQKLETFKDKKRELEKDYNNGIRGANERFTIGKDSNPFTSTNPEFINVLYQYLINHMDKRINELNTELAKFQISK